LSQPICTAIQVALVELFQTWGISPSSVCGHSSGEIAAAFCTGGLTRQSAWKVAYYRGVVADNLRTMCDEPTTMMSVGLGESDVASYLAQGDFSSFVSLGCINSPVNVTLTGTKKHIDQLWAMFDKKEIFARKLAVDIAYHSKFMGAVAREYEALVKGIEGLPAATDGSKTEHKPPITIYSSVTGKAITNQELCEPSYWVKNLTSTVRFYDALTAMVTGGDRNARVPKQAFHNFVEIGPQAALRRPVQDTLAGLLQKDQWLFAPALKANLSDTESALETAGLLWTNGVDVNIGMLHTPSVHTYGTPQLLTDLPVYQFSRTKTYWQESRLSRNYGFRPYRRHQLLGLRAKDWNPGEASWRHFIRAQESPWVMDHGVSWAPKKN
jgi:acyl transferase domain-containing protein